MGMTITTLAIETVECVNPLITSNLYNAWGSMSSRLKQWSSGTVKQ
jgi:hypothetical protein